MFDIQCYSGGDGRRAVGQEWDGTHRWWLGKSAALLLHMLNTAENKAELRV